MGNCPRYLLIEFQLLLRGNSALLADKRRSLLASIPFSDLGFSVWGNGSSFLNVN